MPTRPNQSQPDGTPIDPFIRLARDNDAGGLIPLIEACFADYPGCVLDVDGEMPYLRAIASAFARRRGQVWVAEHRGDVVGVVGLRPAPAIRTMQLMTLYVAHQVRRQGLGSELIALAEAEARQRGARWVELWTDTRFTDAHRLYERLGYKRLPRTRALHDLSDTVEYHYVKAVGAKIAVFEGMAARDRVGTETVPEVLSPGDRNGGHTQISGGDHGLDHGADHGTERQAWSKSASGSGIGGRDPGDPWGYNVDDDAPGDRRG